MEHRNGKENFRRFLRENKEKKLTRREKLLKEIELIKKTYSSRPFDAWGFKIP